MNKDLGAWQGPSTAPVAASLPIHNANVPEAWRKAYPSMTDADWAEMKAEHEAMLAEREDEQDARYERRHNNSIRGDI